MASSSLRFVLGPLAGVLLVQRRLQILLVIRHVRHFQQIAAVFDVLFVGCHLLVLASIDLDVGYDHEFAYELLLWVRTDDRRGNGLRFLNQIDRPVVLQFWNRPQVRVDVGAALHLGATKFSLLTLLGCDVLVRVGLRRLGAGNMLDLEHLGLH